MRTLVGFTQSSFDPASRFRFIQFVPFFRRASWEVLHRPNRPDRQWKSPIRNRLLRAAHYRVGRLMMIFNRAWEISQAGEWDAVFVNRDLAGNGLLHAKLLHRINRSVIFDFDDAIFLGRNERAIRWMCEHAACVTPGNEYLASYVRRYTDRYTVIPTVIDTELYQPDRIAELRGEGVVRVGWSGSDQSLPWTLGRHLEMLKGLQRKLGFELVVISNSKPSIEGLRWNFIPWTPENEPHLGRYFDIGIMPLEESEFMKGKCGLKILQYMACGIPCIAAPVGVNEEIVLDGETGFLAKSEGEWHDALKALISRRNLRTRMGEAGRRRCEDAYSIKKWFPEIQQVYESVATIPGSGQTRLQAKSALPQSNPAVAGKRKITSYS